MCDKGLPGMTAPTPAGVTAVVVLAAGAGTRMKSAIPKVMHPMAGRPLLWHALTAARGVRPQSVVAVIGHGREMVAEYLSREMPDTRIAIQDQQLGTGHAVQCALAELGPSSGTVLVTYGDVPLLRTETLDALADAHNDAGNAVTVLTATLRDATGYGRIVRDAAGRLERIVEQRDATAEQLALREVNTGVYAFDGAALSTALDQLTSDNSQGERYLTDVVGILRGAGAEVGTVIAADPVETEGVNDRVQLADLARTLNARLVRAAQLAGVTFQDPQTTWLHADVVIEADAAILRNTSLEAGTTVAADAVIGPDTTLIDCRIGRGASVVRSHCHGAVIAAGASVGPFSYLRQGADLAEGSKVGAYVEVKESRIGRGAKVPHLSYVGDADLGAEVNVSAGSITANYDGAAKFHTDIAAGAFVGSNSTLIAPVTIGAGAYVAAGSTVTDDVEVGALAVARGRQATKPGWVATRKPGTAMARAAAPADPAASPATAAPSEILDEVAREVSEEVAEEVAEEISAGSETT